MEVSPAVAALALHPFRDLPPAPGVEQVEQDGIFLAFHPFPSAQTVEPLDLDEAGVPAAVATARTLARERDKRLLAWWIAPEHRHLGSALEHEGLVNEDTPGFEAVENAMALVHPPSGEGDSGVVVDAVETYEEFTGAMTVAMDAFEMPEAMRTEAVAGFPRRWEEYRHPDNPGRQYLARSGDEIVGTAAAAFGHAGVNLFGGAVLRHARGRGVYRALTVARWEEAVQRETPALTVQAGRMSMPILTRLGFEPVGKVRLYVDDLGARDG